MSKVWLSMRFSSVGVMLAGVGSAITGCTAEDAIKAVLIWLALALGGAVATEETTTGGGAAAPTAIVLFSAGTTASGDFKTIGAGTGGREGADNICKNATIPTGVDPTTVHAFISVTGTDQLKDLHTLSPGFSAALPVTGPPPALIQISSNWNNIFGTILLATFRNAGVTIDSGDISIWTGTKVNGSVASGNCVSWTSSTDSSTGFVGLDTFTNSAAIATTTSPACDSMTIELTCAGAFTP